MNGLANHCILLRTLGEPTQRLTQAEKRHSAPLPQPGTETGTKVYRARQISLNRIVALKLIHAGRFAGLEEVARFRREAESAARLDHPNIVHIYEVGCHEGQNYFTMKFVAGGTLAHRLSNLASPISNRDAATLLAAIARALHHAHR